MGLGDLRLGVFGVFGTCAVGGGRGQMGVIFKSKKTSVFRRCLIPLTLTKRSFKGFLLNID